MLKMACDDGPVAILEDLLDVKIESLEMIRKERPSLLIEIP